MTQKHEPLNPRSKEAQRMWQIAARYSYVGIEMAAGVGVGGFGGAWLDRRFGTEPLFFWIGLVLGVGVAVRAVVHAVKRTRWDRL